MQAARAAKRPSRSRERGCWWSWGTCGRTALCAKRSSRETCGRRDRPAPRCIDTLLHLRPSCSFNDHREINQSSSPAGHSHDPCRFHPPELPVECATRVARYVLPPLLHAARSQILFGATPLMNSLQNSYLNSTFSWKHTHTHIYIYIYMQAVNRAPLSCSSSCVVCKHGSGMI
jgi:hypothetical protein